MITEARAGVFPESGVQATGKRSSRVLGRIAYGWVALILVLSAVPYGSSEFWWKAFFICCLFAGAIVGLIDGYRNNTWVTGGGQIILSAILLTVFAFIQTIPLGSTTPGIELRAWNAISADPFATRFFALQLLGLIIAGILLFRYANTESRLRSLAHVLIAVAVVSAVFGILRQTTQRELGFGLPLLQVDQGYGQFINKNHFAFLMEMGFGLTLGLVLGGGVKRDRGLIYLGALLPIWTSLVLCNSRGGLLAMMAQVLSAALIFPSLHPARGSEEGSLLRFFRLWPARVLLLAILLFGLTLGTLWMGGDRLAARLEHSSQEFDAAAAESRQNVSRGQIWRATWKMFSAHPLTGVGLGGYWAAIPTFHDASGTMTPQEAHNDYLELLASGGLAGSVIGVWLMVAVFRKTKLNMWCDNGFRRAAAFGAALAMIGVAVHSLVDFGLHLFINALAFTVIVVIGTSTLKAQGESEGNHRL
ncbi:MAG TPA: O-antigen ligase family protein [Pyrinomonadaceae bacterium]|nr:O-antigen ligase family protein [Pyrinomonadaceae bacterium]